jgi:hypothetical protein
MLERRNSKSEDLTRNKKQKWKCEKQQREEENSEEENTKGNEKGKAATERRNQLRRFG